MPSAQPPASVSSISPDPSSSPAPTGRASGADSSNPAAASAADKDKPRLTEQEKKNNHIASEQKRRAAIREGFDRLTELVPGLEGQGRSESIVLKKTVEFMHLQLQERRNLIAEIERRGGIVEDSFRR
ncbi:transcriptional regulator family: Helix-loop-helix [Paecilomyces variotii]|nr:transcriptional regulator family: Helix-loop-helix [Paecilomyces variotii]